MIQCSFNEENIIAMDETACWMDMPSDTTVTFSGSCSVSLRTTGNELSELDNYLTLSRIIVNETQRFVYTL